MDDDKEQTQPAGDTEHEIEAREQAFFTEDASLLAPVLKKLITLHVFKILPKGYSANQLTLSGGACALFVPFSLWFASIEIEQKSVYGQSILLVSAFLLIAYAVFDQLDGMQARRLGTSNSFGDFIDHWVDTSIANLAPVPIMLMVGLGDALVFWMAFVVLLAFWSSNWEIRIDNRRLLPKVGGLESILVGMVILIATAMLGVEIWQAEVRFGEVQVPITWIIYAVTFPWLLVVVAQTAMRAGAGIGRLSLDMFAFLATLSPLIVWLLWFASSKDQAQLFNFGYISIGILSTLMTGALMRQHWLGFRYRAFNVGYFALGLVIIGLEFLAISADQHRLIFGLLVAGLVGLLVHQGLDTFSRTMGTKSKSNEAV